MFYNHFCPIPYALVLISNYDERLPVFPVAPSNFLGKLQLFRWRKLIRSFAVDTRIMNEMCQNWFRTKRRLNQFQPGSIQINSIRAKLDDQVALPLPFVSMQLYSCHVMSCHVVISNYFRFSITSTPNSNILRANSHFQSVHQAKGKKNHENLLNSVIKANNRTITKIKSKQSIQIHQ